VPSLTTLYSRALLGINTPLVTIETHLANGFPCFTMVGLPEAAVRESRDRVRSALSNTQCDFPVKRITVNLAPADLPKSGGRFDLAVAIGILSASGQLPVHELLQYEFLGELALSGELRPVTGILPVAIACKQTNRALIIPQKNAEEAALISGLTIYAANHLTDVFAHLTKKKPLAPIELSFPAEKYTSTLDMKDIIGQKQARRALEISAAGGHSLLMQGPPGTGKTMLASRLPSILPEMTEEESLEAAAIASISLRGFKSKQWATRPFRSPHHSASSVALAGGGNPPRPGEISLAHQGVLFLDELPEFSRAVLETLREPLESGAITISRAAIQTDFPANFQLIAAMNPCPCGYLGDTEQPCQCSTDQIQRYHHKISGPLLERIDLHIQVPRIPTRLLTTQTKETRNESSHLIRQRTKAARARQLARASIYNAKLNQKQLQQFCILDKLSQKLIETAIERLHLSARAYHKTLKVARTIADLDQQDAIHASHLSEALSYRARKTGSR